MKKTNILYWIFTILFALMMGATAIPDVVNDPEAIKFMNEQLGYPLYFLPFIGVAKILGAIAILIPGFPRIKEWAYAGLMYDLIAAIYSIISIGTPLSDWIFLLLPLFLGTTSYIFYHKKLKG